MDTLPADIQLQIYGQLSLNDCLALSDTCQTLRSLWSAVDDSFVKTLVLQHVPWFTLNDDGSELTTWDKCARVVVARSSGKLLGIKSLNVPMTFDNAPVRVKSTDVTFDSETRTNMEPLFDQKLLCAHFCDSQTGSKLHNGSQWFDLKTLQVGTEEVKKSTATSTKFGVSERGEMCVSPSGITVVHSDQGGVVHVLAENDNLLLVRFTTRHSFRGPDSDMDSDNEEDAADIKEHWESQKYFDEGDKDCVIHKASFERDERGFVVIDEDTVTQLYPQFDDFDAGTTFINLLPGAGGAFVLKYTTQQVCSSFLGYIEPTESLEHVIICAIPLFRDFMAFEYVSYIEKFWISYNGYLYIQFEGRLIQLWVDMGLRKQVNIVSESRRALGLDLLTQEKDYKAYTAVNKNFPTLGTFIVQGMMYRSTELIQNGRYVTFTEAAGRVVGDLLSGKTYFVRDWLSQSKIAIPFKSEAGVGFYSLHSQMTVELVENMKDAQFDALCKQFQDVVEPNDPKARYDSFKYEKNDFFQHPIPVQMDSAFIEDNFHDAPESVSDDGDLEDWDLAGSRMRNAASRYVEETVDTKDLYKAGYDDAVVRKVKDVRCDEMDYYKGFHAGYRARNGYTEESDQDCYWGSNPNHGVDTGASFMVAYYLNAGRQDDDDELVMDSDDSVLDGLSEDLSDDDLVY